MLNNISWQGYWTALATTTLLYYAFLLLFFYRKQWGYGLHQWFTASADPMPQEKVKDHQLNALEEENACVATLKEAPGHLPIVHSLVDELHSFFESIPSNTYTKEDLLV